MILLRPIGKISLYIYIKTIVSVTLMIILIIRFSGKYTLIIHINIYNQTSVLLVTVMVTTVTINTIDR